jgi:hypothetical protein
MNRLLLQEYTTAAHQEYQFLRFIGEELPAAAHGGRGNRLMPSVMPRHAATLHTREYNMASHTIIHHRHTAWRLTGFSPNSLLMKEISGESRHGSRQGSLATEYGNHPPAPTSGRRILNKNNRSFRSPSATTRRLPNAHTAYGSSIPPPALPFG